MDKRNKEAEEAMRSLIELDFPTIKIEQFVSYKKTSDSTIVGQINTKDGLVFTFYIDFANSRPMLQRYV